MTNSYADVERRLWESADELRANSGLRSWEYSVPVLGLIFLRFADQKFSLAQQQIEGTPTGRRVPGKTDYQARGVVYLPPESRFSTLLNLPEGADIGRATNDAMAAVERENEDLRGVLPRTYTRLPNASLVALLRSLSRIPIEIEGDVFGRIYEYFLGRFAMSEGQRGGEFFTPIALVKLIVEVIEPYHGLIYDPACGSGGMFVQSAGFVQNHQKNPSAEISIYGQEAAAETVRLCRMNLAVHGLSGDIRQGNSYHEDPHNSRGAFDFVMANPPFNVNGVDVMISIGPNFFYTVTLPCTLWFLDRGKRDTEREDTVLFIDARQDFTQIDRAHREFTPEQIEYLANIVRLYRREEIGGHGGDGGRDVGGGCGDVGRDVIYNVSTAETFPDGRYRDVPGLCRVATRAEIAAQNWSLNPGRYVGVAAREADGFVFAERLEELHEELKALNRQARVLEERIAGNVAQLLERT